MYHHSLGVISGTHLKVSNLGVLLYVPFTRENVLVSAGPWEPCQNSAIHLPPFALCSVTLSRFSGWRRFQRKPFVESVSLDPKTDVLSKQRPSTAIVRVRERRRRRSPRSCIWTAGCCRRSPPRRLMGLPGMGPGCPSHLPKQIDHLGGWFLSTIFGEASFDRTRKLSRISIRGAITMTHLWSLIIAHLGGKTRANS